LQRSSLRFELFEQPAIEYDDDLAVVVHSDGHGHHESPDLDDARPKRGRLSKPNAQIPVVKHVPRRKHALFNPDVSILAAVLLYPRGAPLRLGKGPPPDPD
jgi:hypothetical protein